MKNRRMTIRKIVGTLNNADEDGGLWLPNIQRPFVWSEDQICKLFDSILREYPISTLLVWRTISEIKHRKFIDCWKQSLKISDFYVSTNIRRKNLVLDGQQRLQSLYIGLCGAYDGKELCFNILSGESAAPDDIKYAFRFINPKEIQFPWIRIKSLVFDERKKREIRDAILVDSPSELSDKDIDKISDHLDLIESTFKSQETITYQELDSVENPGLYKEDDVVEVFIRANSGGTKLGKSDLLFSLLSTSWDSSDEKMDDLLETINKHGFDFDRDFVLKTCLVLLNQGARYEVIKFRKPEVREQIEEKWTDISSAIKTVVDFVYSKTYIRCDKALPSYLVLIPLISLRYHYKSAWDNARDLDQYLLRCLLAGAFGGHSDALLDALVKTISENKKFVLDDIFNEIRSQGRSLELTTDRFWSMGYGSRNIHLLFNIWYKDFNHIPAYENNLPQVDHIFPKSVLSEIKVKNPETNRFVMKYPDVLRNQLANCMLLTQEENGAGGKGATLPKSWFSDKPTEYLERHLIPNVPALWEIDRYDDFIAARKQMLKDKFAFLLQLS